MKRDSESGVQLCVRKVLRAPCVPLITIAINFNHYPLLIYPNYHFSLYGKLLLWGLEFGDWSHEYINK